MGRSQAEGRYRRWPARASPSCGCSDAASPEDWSADGDFPKPLSGRSGTGYAPRRSAEASRFHRPGAVASGPPSVPFLSARAGTSPTGGIPNGRSRALCNKRLLTPFDTSEGAHSLKRSSPRKGTADRYPGAWLCCPCKSPIPPSQGMVVKGGEKTYQRGGAKPYH